MLVTIANILTSPTRRNSSSSGDLEIYAVRPV